MTVRLESYRVRRRGLRVLIRSKPIDDMLERRADRVRVVAESGYAAALPHTGGVEVEVVQVDSDSDRARVAVIARHPAALAIEGERRVLGGAIGAARA